MIKVIDNKFIRVDTKNNTLVFYITGELPETIYYGKKLKKDTDFTPFLGITDITGVDMRDYVLSQFGKEDYKEPSIKIKNSNGTFVSDFKFAKFELNKPLIALSFSIVIPPVFFSIISQRNDDDAYDRQSTANQSVHS